MIKVEVDSSVAGARLAAMGGKVRSNLLRVIRSLTLEVEARVKQKLSGDVLHVRTGLLRSSITSRTQVEGDSVVGSVGTNVSYARVHEFGFNGVVTVAAHIRRTQAQMRRATYSVKGKDGERIYKVRQTGKFGKSAGAVTVKTHQRHVNLPERSFLRSSLNEIADKARADILMAVREGMA